jgi:protein O-GlcNAc transferase
MQASDTRKSSAEREALRLIDEGNTCEDQGRIDDAMRRYESAVRVAPWLPRAHLNLGNVRMARGDLPGAVKAFAEALGQNPDYAAAHYNLGNAQVHLGLHEAALASYRKAASSKPDFADAEVAMGALLRSVGRHEDAVASYRRALKIDSGHVAAYCGLGDVQKDLGKYDDAAQSYSHAITIAPERADVHCMLGVSLMVLGRPHDAVTSYRQAVKINPNFAEAHCSLGNALKDVGDREAAVESYRRALEIDSSLADAHSNLGTVLKEMGRAGPAVECFRKALQLRPGSAEVHYNLANALKDLGQFDGAVASYRRALEIKADFAAAHYNLANAQRDLQKHEDAVASYRSAIRINDEYYDAHNNLGNALLDLGRMDEALASYKRALTIKPDLAIAASNVLFNLSHSEDITPDKLFDEHRRFGAQFEAPLRNAWPLHENSRDPDRQLRIGFVSGDLHDHAVAYFFEPLLMELAGRRSLSLHAYYNHRVEDIVSKRMRANFSQWHAIARLTDAALAQKIRDDGIDILVDLSGHTGDTRLLTFARKPAPIQASWLGYPGTTGLSAMDYYLADRHFLPFDQFQGQFIEKLVHLPAVVPFLPSPLSPPVNRLPASSNGYITFGSFNRLSKVTPTAIALWSRLLRALPDSRMLIAGMPADGKVNPLVAAFARQGIASERLRFHPRCGIAEYLALHHQVDICLDTYPYTGGTTTSHALWMGVPTLSLAGPTPPSRQGAALLGQVGLEAFVTNDAIEFERKGLEWAGSRDTLAQLRGELRQWYERSPLRDTHAISIGLEQALQAMWQLWCAGKPAQQLDMSKPKQGPPPGDD